MRLADRDVPVTAARDRTLLAMLLLHANRVTPTERLVEAIWPTGTPRDARTLLQGCVSRLRKRFAEAGAAGQIVTTEPAGYRITIDSDGLDLLEFRRLLAEARTAGQHGKPEQAADLYRAALSRWRGPALAGIDSPLVRQAATALDEEHTQALEERFAAELAAGRGGELVPELTEVVAQHPHREGFHRSLMLALYRADRQADALAAYRHARQLLQNELGTEPGHDLQELHRAILNRDPDLGTQHQPTPTLPPAPTPRELPADVAAFTGRFEALKALDELLSNGQDTTGPVVISAIAGTAGVGKTALAVHWAHQVADHFPDGQLYINLRGYASAAPLRPIEALSMLLRSLAVPPEQIPAEEAEASARYRSLLADRRVLIVLDNAGSADQVRPLLPGSAGCLVLVTSRDRLGGLVARDGARRLTLDVLPPTEAYGLLARLLGPDRAGAEPESTAALAKVCAYLPLALRVAAAVIEERPHDSVTTLVSELAAGDRLTTLEVADDEATAVRAAFDLSYHALSEPAQRLFRLLGLVPGPDVTATGAAALADLSVDETTRLLRKLAAAHLVDEHTAGRFTFHDLLREYAAERAAHDETDTHRAAAINRLLDWYLAATDAASKLLRPDGTRLPLPPGLPHQRPVALQDRGEALAWLHNERANLVAAVQRAAERGPKLYAWLLTDRLRYYLLLRRSVDGLTVGQLSLEAANAEGGPRDQAAAHIALANAYFCLRSEHAQAIDHCQQASALAEHAGWLDGQALANNNAAIFHLDTGRPEQANAHLARALTINQRSGHRGRQADNLGNLAYVRCDQGKLPDAHDLWTHALEIHSETGNTNGVAITYANLGRVNWLLGQLHRGIEHAAEAVRLHRDSGHRNGGVYALRILASALCDAGRHQEALPYASEAEKLASEGDHATEAASVANAMAEVYRGLDRPADARVQFERALEPRERQQYARVEAMIGLAAVGHDLGDDGYAHEYAIQALDTARQVGYRVLEGQALTVIAAIKLGQGPPVEAREYAERALASHRETGYRLGEARALVLLNRIAQVADDKPAGRWWREARELFDDIGAPVPADLAEGLVR